MKTDVNLPPGPRQRLFLDYLNSQLRARTPGFSGGSAGYRRDGSFESSITGPFSVDQEQIPLTWRVVKSPEGNLLFVEAVRADDGPSNVNWERAVHEFITSVLSATLAERRKSFFRRVFFNYVGVQLDGEYWLPGIRFAPAWPDDDWPQLVYAERVVSLDMQVEAIDEMDAMVLSHETARRQATRLSLLLDVGLYQTPLEARWVIPITEGRPVEKAVRYQMGFLGYGPEFNEMPKKESVCPLGKYSGSLTVKHRRFGELLSLPSQARKILRTVDAATPGVTDSFDRGARLYQVGAVVGRQFPSAGLAYRVAAVEAISKADTSCKGFSDFMRKYVKSQPNSNELFEYLYGKARSGHFHGGEFPLGEFEVPRAFDPLMDSDFVQKSENQLMWFEITREAIVNWIFDLLPDVGNEC